MNDNLLVLGMSSLKDLIISTYMFRFHDCEGMIDSSDDETNLAVMTETVSHEIHDMIVEVFDYHVFQEELDFDGYTPAEQMFIIELVEHVKDIKREPLCVAIVPIAILIQFKELDESKPTS